MQDVIARIQGVYTPLEQLRPFRFSTLPQGNLFISSAQFVPGATVEKNCCQEWSKIYSQ